MQSCVSADTCSACAVFCNKYCASSALQYGLQYGMQEWATTCISSIASTACTHAGDRTVSYSHHDAPQHQSTTCFVANMQVVRNKAMFPSPVIALGSQHTVNEAIIAENGTVLQLAGLNTIFGLEERCATTCTCHEHV